MGKISREIVRSFVKENQLKNILRVFLALQLKKNIYIAYSFRCKNFKHSDFSKKIENICANILFIFLQFLKTKMAIPH